MGIQDRDYYSGGDPTPHWGSEEERERERRLHAESQARLSRAIESNWRTGRTGRKAQHRASADDGTVKLLFGTALLFLGAFIWGAKIIRWITQLFGADSG